MEISITKRPLTSYRGRFAPSPSGFLHFGSLIAALASFLHAKSQRGTWLVRIEDIDPPREKEGASQNILNTLEAFGLCWDENVLYQSQQTALYQEVLHYLSKNNLSYACQCSRADIKKLGGIYQGQCRHLLLSAEQQAIRLTNDHGIHQYQDIIQGQILCDPLLAEEDFILRRKDGLFAYQLAVVVDDIYQGISHVIRGCDLLDPTARQLSLYQVLNHQAPQYGHFPLAITEQGYKLSKQNKAPAINIKQPQPALIAALNFLGQHPPNELISATVEEIITWAIRHWSLKQIPKRQKIIYQEQ